MNNLSVETILEVLETTKESNQLPDDSEFQQNLLIEIGAHQNEYGWVIDRNIRIDLAIAAVSLGAEIERVVDYMTWKDFEGFVARILREHNFECIESFRKVGNSERKGMEIDVIGVRNHVILSVDAKMWSIRGGKTSALRKAGEKQAKRTHKLQRELPRIADKIPAMKRGTYILRPALVTWFVEDVEIHDGVPVIPIFKLNSFLLNYSQFEDRMIAFKGTLSE